MSMSRIPDAIMQLDGSVSFNGVTMSYTEYLDALEEWIDDHVDGLRELRDPVSDIQNLWGTKRDHFRDDVYRRTPPIKRPTGYPSEIGDDDWKTW